MGFHLPTRLLFILPLALIPTWLGAGEITLVRTFATWPDSIILSTDPAGITYHPPSGHLVIVDSEINEANLGIWDSANVFEVSLAGDTVFATFDTRSPSGNEKTSHEPTGITYNPLDGFFYITNDDVSVFYRSTGAFGTGSTEVFIPDDDSTATDPEDITVDPNTGYLYIADGNGGSMQILVYDDSLQFITKFSVADVLDDAGGITYSSVNNHLFVLGGSKIAEYTLAGVFVDLYGISCFSPTPIAPDGLTFAPSSDTTDNPDDYNLYIVDPQVDNNQDSTERDGIVYEANISLPPLPIHIASFTGTIVNARTVRLDWITISEVNNYGFEVQKSAATPNNYQAIPNSFIPGHGTTNVPHHYTYLDTTASVGTWYYRLKQIDLNGTVHYTDGIQVAVLTDVEEEEEQLPTAFTLEQNYPNPFNPSTQIQFALPKASHVKLEIYNLLGKRIVSLVDETRQAGYYSEQFDATGLASGLYFYRLQAGDFVDAKMLLLLK